ncbi:hypothetical protein VTN02DRAFT_2227 [Thermoascus thermophilus]
MMVRVVRTEVWMEEGGNAQRSIAKRRDSATASRLEPLIRLRGTLGEASEKKKRKKRKKTLSVPNFPFQSTSTSRQHDQPPSLLQPESHAPRCHAWPVVGWPPGALALAQRSARATREILLSEPKVARCPIGTLTTGGTTRSTAVAGHGWLVPDRLCPS